MFKALLKSPIFLVRWANAAIMRILPAYAVFACMYWAVYRFIYGVDPAEPAKTPFLTLLMVVICIVWGFIHAALRPTVLKTAYLLSYTRKYCNMTTQMALKKTLKSYITGRVLMSLVYVIGLSNWSTLLGRCLALFCLAELIISCLILYKIPASGQNEQLDRMYNLKG